MTSPDKKRILLVCRKPPYGNALAREAIDIALATAVFEQNLAIAFVGDGVWQLHPGQNSEQIPGKNQQKLLSALPVYDINELFVDEQALRERHIDASQLILAAKPLSNKALSALFDQADIILNF